VTKPDGASVTTYQYNGSVVTVFDPTGKWKSFSMDTFGNLVYVTEPNPAGGANYGTTYTYDLLNHLIGVSMPRPSGTQTRTFNYGTPPGPMLQSATNPENGTTNYTYDPTYRKVATKTDAKGQQIAYGYDSLARLTSVHRLQRQGPPPNRVTITARFGTPGNGGGPFMALSVNGNLIGSWFPSAGLEDYSIVTEADLTQAKLHVELRTYPYGGTIYVDHITLNGVVFSSSSSTAYNSCGPAQSPWLTCNGYLEFPTTSTGTAPGPLVEDTCQQENYSYDSNPYDANYSQNVNGRLAAKQYFGGAAGIANGNSASCATTFTEMYSYSSPAQC